MKITKTEIIQHLIPIIVPTILGTAISMFIFWIAGYFDKSIDFDVTCNKIEVFHYEDQKMTNSYSKVIFDDIDHIKESDDRIIIYLKPKEEKTE